MDKKLKSTVNATLFVEALSRVSKAVLKTNARISKNIKITFSYDKCTITGTDFDCWVEEYIPAWGDVFSLILSNTKSALKACEYFNGNIVFEMLPNDVKVVLIEGDRIVTQDCFHDECPGFPILNPITATCSANAKTLAQCVNKVKYATISDSSRPILAGICFTGETVVALDGIRMALSKVPGFNIDGEFVVPTTISKLLEAFGSDDLTIEFSKNYALFRSSNLKICIRRLEGEYIQVKRIIPLDADVKDVYSINTAEYLKELKFLSDIIGSKKREYIKFDNGTLHVLTKRGDFSTRVHIFGTADMVYGFECKYMLDAINQFKKSKSVTIKIFGQYSPIMITDGEADTDLALVLPANIDRIEKEMVA